MSSLMEINKICEFCGSDFIAHKTTTRYCSLKCNSKAYKQRIRQEKIKTTEKRAVVIEKNKSLGKIKDKEFFNISETALFIGVSRPTIYKYLYNGELKSRRLGGKIFIKRSDVYALFDKEEEYKPRPNIERKPITDLYTVAEIKSKYDVSYVSIYKVVKKKNIPKVSDRGKVYYSKKHIDNYFSSKYSDELRSITDWYTVDDICKKFGMTKTAVYSFVSNKQIPKKKEGMQVFYSKTHVDVEKGLINKSDTYYTVQEATTKFNITRDALYSYIKYHNIPKIKEGKYIKISKPHLDRLFESPIIS